MIKALNSVWPSQLWLQCEKEWNCRAVRSLACQYSYLLLVTHYFRLWPVTKKTASNSQGGWSVLGLPNSKGEPIELLNMETGETTGLLKLIPLGFTWKPQIRPLELRCLQRACTLLVSDLKSFLRWSLQNSFSHVDQTWRGFSHTGCSRHQPTMSVQLGACCCQPTTQFQIWCCPVQVSSFSPDPRLSKLQVSNSFWAEIDRRCCPDDMLGKSGSEVSNWQESFGSTAVWLGSVRLLVVISKKKHRRSTVYVPNQIICHWRCQNISRPGRSPEILPSLGKRMQTEKRLLLRRKKIDVKFQMSTNNCPERASEFHSYQKAKFGKMEPQPNQIKSDLVWDGSHGWGVASQFNKLQLQDPSIEIIHGTQYSHVLPSCTYTCLGFYTCGVCLSGSKAKPKLLPLQRHAPCKHFRRIWT